MSNNIDIVPEGTTLLVTKKEEAVVPAKAMPLVSIEDTVNRLQDVRRFITKALNTAYQKKLKSLKGKQITPDQSKALKALEIDYGTVPGVNKKFLMQPGAEKLCLWLHVRPAYETVQTDLPEGHLEISSRCRLLAVNTDKEVFSGPICSCSSMESNFRFVYVEMDPQPPREWQFKEGQICRKLGTHKSWKETRQGKEVWIWSERHDNPNIWDKRNNVRQIAEKRALVKAVRNFGAMSEIFTEDPSEWDLEDMKRVEEAEPKPNGAVVKAVQAELLPKKELVVKWSEDKQFAFVADTNEFTETCGAFDKILKSWKIPANYIHELGAWCSDRGIKMIEVSA